MEVLLKTGFHHDPQPNRAIARSSFNNANTFDRSNQFVDLIGQAFEKTESEMDDIFINANKLKIQ